MSTASYLDEMLDPVAAALTPEAAQRIIDTQLRPELQAHLVKTYDRRRMTER